MTAEWSTQQEHRAPWTELLVPAGLLAARSIGADEVLAANQGALVTGFDLHRTLLRVLAPERMPSPPWAFDLLSERVPRGTSSQNRQNRAVALVHVLHHAHAAHTPSSGPRVSTRILVKTMWDAVRNTESWKRRRTPTQDPSTAAAQCCPLSPPSLLKTRAGARVAGERRLDSPAHTRARNVFGETAPARTSWESGNFRPRSNPSCRSPQAALKRGATAAIA